MDRVALIREHVPDCAITTDIIVGFPGETEADFEQTLEVVDEVGYDGAFTFIFSPRRGTEAAELRRPAAARDEARADGAPRRARPAAGARARRALRRPHDGGPGRGPEPDRRVAAARPDPAQQDGQLRRHRRTRRAGRGGDHGRDLDDALRPGAPAQPRGLRGRILALFGPTAVGKTGVAIEVAERLRERGEDPVAVNCDSIQVYRGPGDAERRRDARRSVSDSSTGCSPSSSRARSSAPAATPRRRTARSTPCWRRGRGRSWSAAPASTCERRWRTSTCGRRCRRRSARRWSARSPSAVRRRSTPSSTRSWRRTSTRTTASAWRG